MLAGFLAKEHLARLPSAPPALKLADDWVTFSAVACVLVCVKAFQLVESRGRSDQGLLVGGGMPNGTDGRRQSGARRD